VKRALLVLVMVACAAPAGALMLEVPFDRLVSTSDAVVRAKVTNLESSWTSDHSTIVTDVTLVIEESWVGTMQAGAPLRLQVEGGEVGDLGVRVEHQPTFRLGEESVLFLAGTPSARLRVNALEQGKFTIVGDQAVGWGARVIPLSVLHARVDALRPGRAR
jgi:hypothetical protein